MAELPSGTVTFLFTDIEGSTRMWEKEPDAMRSALALHDAVVHGAIAECRGRLVKSTGDGAFAAFEQPHDAVDAAVAAQIALAEAEWPAPLVLRSRIGVHSGQATEQDGDYFGPDVNRAARIMSAAHGGQIVCSAVVGEQVRDRFALVDLGEHRLRDLQSPVRLVQVDVPGLGSVFPPLRSLDAYRSNLPYELSSFVGREDELDAVAELVRGSRVVSIVGVGGVGKTRLGLQVGSELLPEHADGVWLCELASVVESADLPGAVAAALGYTPPQGVSIADGLSRYLERKELLLLLDNCEHLVSAVASFVTSTTARAPRVFGVGYESRGARRAGRAHVSSAVAAAARSARRPVGAGFGGGRAVRRPRGRSTRRSRYGCGERGGRARSVCTARRDPAGDRARRRADEGDGARRDSHPARQTVPTPRRRTAHKSGATPNPSRGDRLVLRPSGR